MAMMADGARRDAVVAPSDDLAIAALLFHGLGDASRLAILHHLQLGEHRVVDLTAHLGLSQSTVSKHLATLREAGMVTVRPVGRASMYSLAHPEAVAALLVAAEGLLALTGDAITLRPLDGEAAAAGEG